MYDGFIFDQFGVMHNGAVALEGAPALVDRLAAAGKKLGILSNSSKRKEWTLRELPKLESAAPHALIRADGSYYCNFIFCFAITYMF